MDEHMQTRIPKERFKAGNTDIVEWFNSEYASIYMGELMEIDKRDVHFWQMSAPNTKYDLLVRMGVTNDRFRSSALAHLTLPLE